MPSKRKSNLSQKTKKARGMAIARREETSPQADLRRVEQAERQTVQIVNETLDQTRHRRQQRAEYVATLREAETAEQREARRRQHAEYLQTQRAAETEDALQARRRAVAERAANRRQALNRQTWAGFDGAAFEYDATLDYCRHKLIRIERMDKECSHCRALKWKEETPGMCCSGGKVSIKRLEQPLEPMKQLFENETEESRHFLSNIRRYNSCFHMTSFGADKIVTMPGFSPTFTIQGQVYHRIGSLIPETNSEPKFLQLYFINDYDTETERRCQTVQGVRKETIEKVQQVLHNNNTLIIQFKTAMENMPVESCTVVIHPDRVPCGQHERRFNAPSTSEIAAVVVGNEFTTARDIVLRKRDNTLSRVSDTHRFYDALQYPIIFWKGQEGYHFNIPQINPTSGQPLPNKKVSCMDYYAFLMMVQKDDFNLILRCRQLFSQFLVDIYVKIESERLRYISLNQKKLRAENYIHLQDAIRNDAEVDSRNIGQIVILPSSFVNSPRYLHEYTQDAFTYVRNYGRPDLFITMTCNPAWKEITDELLPGQRATDRHDLIARIFKMKVQKLVSVLTKGKVFGEEQCFMYSIEWQKRGLPHVHLLLWLKEKLRPNSIDNVISAEMPDPIGDKDLFDIVVKNMIHGPCGAQNPSSPCMKNGKCTKKYPRALLRETQTNDSGYPLYKRTAPEHGGRTTTIRIRGGQGETLIDNGWIVPHSPLLSKMFNAHINVEFCNSVQAIKYICKYINKGSDQAIIHVQQDNTNIDPRDEVQTFKMGRYVSSNEAAWRILGLPLHERHPTVIHLAVHLPNGERVYFTEQNFLEKVVTPPRTTLTAFFQLCRNDAFAKTLMYTEVPRYYTWDASRKEWKRRIQGTAVENWPGVKAGDALGRVYTVHVSNFECYCLRLLLNQIRGPTSFQELKTVGGQEKATFREACQSLGLLEDDNHWDVTMAEAVLCRSPAKVRELFAILISTCGLSNPLQLWEKYKRSLSEDITHRFHEVDRANEGFVFNEALKIIEDKIVSIVGKKLEDYGMPVPQRRGELTSEVMKELSYDTAALEVQVHEMVPHLLPEQRIIYDKLLSSISSEEGRLFFIDAPGGTGKTFLLNLLLARVRRDHKIALAVASSGIAATLLSGGRTAHSVFKIPLNLTSEDTPTCNISKGSDRSNLLQQCKLIVWDEVTMSHKRALEALNRSLQDIRNNRALMGGAVVLLAGDFRQTLPVIERGTPADEINACLKSSPLWAKVEKLHLITNMRVQLYNDRDSGAYSRNLLQIGDDLMEKDEDGNISFSSEFCQPANSEDKLILSVFPDLQIKINDKEWLCERTILAPRNDSVTKINEKILQKIAGEATVYTSIDTVMSTDNATTYPVEFLNSLEPSGVPPHKLKLKVGVPVLLMRNLDAPRLCNGTRLQITELGRNIVRATILTGAAKGEGVLIPRIPITPSNLPFQFKRLQFPLRVSFAMTINKSQGQTLKVAGIHLGTPCFSHGQLYVACSRVSSAHNLHVLTENNKSCNIVYREVLR